MKWLTNYVNWLEKNFLLVLVTTSLMAITGAYYTVQLYKNLRTDIEELLPEEAQSVKDLKKAQGRVTGLNHIEVVIESSDIAAAQKLQLDITEKMHSLVPDVASKVKSDIRLERTFFEKNKALYIDTNDWQNILAFIKEKKRAERKKTFDIGLSDDEEKQKNTLNLDALKKKYESKTAIFSHFKNDLFQSKDGHTRIVLAFLPGKVTDMSGNKRLSEATKKIIEEINPKSYAPDMIVGLGGDVQNVVEEHHGLVHDLISSFVIVTILVTLILLLYFRSFSSVIALTFALFTGTFWTFGLSYFLVGYLNANTAFLGSIVIGNGINFGIIFLSRYSEERSKKLSVTSSLITCFQYTARPTFTAALAAGLSYGSLVLTSFRGFSQFGIIGGIGMFLCWLAFYMQLPALLFLLEKLKWIKHQKEEHTFFIMKYIANFILHKYRWILAASFAFLIIAIFGVSHFSSETLESDLSKLRNKESMESGSGYWGKKTDEAFNRNLTPTIILTDRTEDAVKIRNKLQEIHSREGESSPFFEITTVEDLLPKNQQKNISLINEVQKQLTPKIRAKLSKKEKKIVEELLSKEDFIPLKPNDLPKDLLANFTEGDGTIGRMVHVYPKLSLPQNTNSGEKQTVSSTWNGKEVIRYTKLLRESIQSTDTNAVIAGQPPVSADMLATIEKDGPKATAFALIAVSILVFFMFPKIKHATAILFALYLGVLWMAGIIGLYDLKINFLNFITLPITFGIGVDYAVNIFGRYYEESGKSIITIIKNTGGAVVLCSSTTIIGYSSLLLSGSQAFVSFGRLAVLGEFTCILAAIFSLPALWVFLQKEKMLS